MIGMAKGVAHISYPGGGFFLPVRTVSDREVLVRQVTDQLQASGQTQMLQVLIDEQRWLVHRGDGAPRPRCAGCGRALDRAYCCPADGTMARCMPCTFGDTAATAPHSVWRKRRTS
jgi:hypothetical protein